jgi:hypothetical protein
MRVYHDWEFLEQGNSVYPISVGMVREDGAELYMEFADAPWDKIMKHTWLRNNVMPLLNCYTDGSLVILRGTETFKNRLGVFVKVHDFLLEASRDSPLELWGWYSAYDHVCLGQLFGAMVNLPDFVPMYTRDLKQEADRLDVRIPDLRLPNERAHFALDDARAEMRMHKWLMDYELARTMRMSNSRGIQYGNGNSQINTF